MFGITGSNSTYLYEVLIKATVNKKKIQCPLANDTIKLNGKYYKWKILEIGKY